MPKDYPEIEPIPDPPARDLLSPGDEDDLSWSPDDPTADGDER